MKIVLLFLVLLTNNLNSYWEHEFNKNGINVFTRSIENSDFKAFKANVEIDADVKSIVKEIMDVEKYPQWSYKTLSIKLIKRDSNECYFYYISEVPPFVKNREAYYCYKVINTNNHGAVKITMNTYESNIPVPDGFVRIPIVNGFWELVPINSSKTKVIFQMHAEPGGSIPAWLANVAVTDSPYVTLKNLRELVTEE